MSARARSQAIGKNEKRLREYFSPDTEPKEEKYCDRTSNRPDRWLDQVLHIHIFLLLSVIPEAQTIARTHTITLCVYRSCFLPFALASSYFQRYIVVCRCFPILHIQFLTLKQHQTATTTMTTRSSGEPAFSYYLSVGVSVCLLVYAAFANKKYYIFFGSFSLPHSAFFLLHVFFLFRVGSA